MDTGQGVHVPRLKRSLEIHKAHLHLGGSEEPGTQTHAYGHRLLTPGGGKEVGILAVGMRGKKRLIVQGCISRIVKGL